MEREEKKALAEAAEVAEADAPFVTISAEAIVEAATVEAAPVAAQVVAVPMTDDPIADARNLLHARVEAAIDAGDVKAARRLLEAVKALY